MPTLNVIFILDLVLLDGLGKALAHCHASDPFSHTPRKMLIASHAIQRLSQIAMAYKDQWLL